MSELIPPVNEYDHAQGYLSAAIVLVEYGDYECPHCKTVHPVVKALQSALGERLCFVYRHFPLTQIHLHAEQAAEAAEAAGAQNHFWKMHATLYEHSPALDFQHLVKYSRQAGLDASQFTQHLRDRRYRPRVQAAIESAVQSGLRGTPTFFVNGIKHRGGYDFVSLLEALQVAQ